MRPLIIGIDPGSTSAVAAIDFEGNLVDLKSGKNFPPREIISEIIKLGKPVVIASDKAKTPSNVEKIANSLGAEIFSPEEDLDSERKRELGKGENSHEKDAVASARHAYRQMDNKINKINRKAEKSEETKIELAEKFFSGIPLNEDTEKQAEKQNEELKEKRDKKPEVTTGKQDSSPRVERYRKENKRLKRSIDNLDERIEELEKKLKEKEKRRKKAEKRYENLKNEKRQELLKEREISKREGIINDKEEKIRDLEQKLEKTRIRERQYEKAIEVMEKGGKIVPIFEEQEDVELGEESVTRSNEIKQKLLSQGEKIFHVEDLEGVELMDKMIVEEYPDQKFEEILEKYRENR